MKKTAESAPPALAKIFLPPDNRHRVQQVNNKKDAGCTS
jgi:hypothetical protein